jgi:mannitol 2-dehydrogenase
MGYLGYLADFRFIHDVARDAEFDRYITEIMDKEVTELVGDIEGVDLEDYKKTLRVRFANPAIGDQVLRICLDGSAKMPKFVVPSIQEQLEKGGPIAGLTLCVASWIRFVRGVDEHGKEIPLEDPEADRLREAAALCETEAKPFLELGDIFGDLKSSDRFVALLEKQYTSLLSKGGRATLQACLNGEFDQ